MSLSFFFLLVMLLLCSHFIFFNNIFSTLFFPATAIMRRVKAANDTQAESSCAKPPTIKDEQMTMVDRENAEKKILRFVIAARKFHKKRHICENLCSTKPERIAEDFNAFDVFSSRFYFFSVLTFSSFFC